MNIYTKSVNVKTSRKCGEKSLYSCQVTAVLSAHIIKHKLLCEIERIINKE